MWLNMYFCLLFDIIFIFLKLQDFRLASIPIKRNINPLNFFFLRDEAFAARPAGL